MKKAIKDLLNSFSKTAPGVPFEGRLWDGERLQFGSGVPVFVLTLKTELAAKRIFTGGALGFGEEYMDGNIEVEGEFKQLLRFGFDPAFRELRLSLWTKLGALWLYLTSLNTFVRSPRNISHHYDRGNDFYRLWLDASMTYSCAYFRRDGDTLEQAQDQKHSRICRKLQLKEGESLVDIGCGWGGMLFYAAKHYGVKCVGCTLSRPQYDYVAAKVKEEGLGDRITVLLQDYRAISGQFDKFVSVGMFEHVGKRFIPAFMEKTRSLLKPGGIGLLHTIGSERQTSGDPWTLKYIFPGGYVPRLDEIVREMGNCRLVPIDVENLRLHYAKTLDLWSERFEHNVKKIESMFDDKFVRMWRMFLLGSSAGFRYGDSRLYQVTFTNGLNNSLPITREHLHGDYSDTK
jgi:cyclopropane-fatty-acyl-phospholipid synthase